MWENWQWDYFAMCAIIFFCLAFFDDDLMGK